MPTPNCRRRPVDREAGISTIEASLALAVLGLALLALWGTLIYCSRTQVAAQQKRSALLAAQARLEELRVLGRPILVGPSRKWFIGKVLDRPADERLAGTAAAVAAAVLHGAHIVRVHDVAPMRDVCVVADRVRRWHEVNGWAEAGRR